MAAILEARVQLQLAPSPAFCTFLLSVPVAVPQLGRDAASPAPVRVERKRAKVENVGTETNQGNCILCAYITLPGSSVESGHSC